MIKHPVDWYKAGHYVLQAMSDRGMTNRDLSRECGVSVNTIAKLLNGNAITMDSMLAICDAHNLTPDLLLGYLDERIRGQQISSTVHSSWYRMDSTNFHCRICGEMVHRKYKYCPNCGAKMDGGRQ